MGFVTSISTADTAVTASSHFGGISIEKLGMSILLVTHDLGVVNEMCHHVGVMYAGRIVEQGTVDELYDHPQAEYTKQLLKAAE